MDYQAGQYVKLKRHKTTAIGFLLQPKDVRCWYGAWYMHVYVPTQDKRMVNSPGWTGVVCHNESRFIDEPFTPWEEAVIQRHMISRAENPA